MSAQFDSMMDRGISSFSDILLFVIRHLFHFSDELRGKEGNLKADKNLLDIQDLKIAFEHTTVVDKSELRCFYFQRHPNLTEQAFRRILYSLEKQGLITSLGAGVYGWGQPLSANNKKVFYPVFSAEVEHIASILQRSFPYAACLIWETKSLHELMIHQPGTNQIILEIEKDALESGFNQLKEQFAGRIFLDPDRKSIERYVLDTPDSILLLRMVSQSPQTTVQGVPTAKLEKILVDLFADEERFFVFHGQELATIYENAFAAYWVNEKTLFRYAGRRKVTGQLKTFIRRQTSIRLTQPAEVKP